MKKIRLSQVRPCHNEVEKKFAPSHILIKGDLSLITTERRVCLLGDTNDQQHLVDFFQRMQFIQVHLLISRQGHRLRFHDHNGDRHLVIKVTSQDLNNPFDSGEQTGYLLPLLTDVIIINQAITEYICIIAWEALRLGRRLLIDTKILSEDENNKTCKGLVSYGAELVDKESMEKILEETPYLTSQEKLVF